jgi:enhancer of mRNA-decapping protein 3
VLGPDILDLQFVHPKTAEPEPAEVAPADENVKPPVDPAIVSFSKPKDAVIQEKPPTAAPPFTAASSGTAKRSVRRGGRGKKKARETEDASRLESPFSTTVLMPDAEGKLEQVKQPDNSDDPEEILERLQEYQERLDLLENQNKKVRRELNTMIQSTRSSVSGPSWNRVAEPSQRPTEKVTPAGPKGYHGKGWRQSPILKQVDATEEGASRRVKKAKPRRKKKAQKDDLAGWATEDATDIQELGDFDFEGGLAKFDKRGVFEQLRREDAIPAEERLVGHNKLKNTAPLTRPGTFGGTKLHPTENVLDSTQARTTQKPISRRGSARQPSISSESSNADHELRTSSRLSSRIRQKRLPIRSNTSTSNIEKLSRVNTGASVRVEARHITSSTSNENATRLTPAESPTAFQSSSRNYSLNFYLYGNFICPTISPGGMTALETIASSEQNLTPDTLNENAGRTLSQIIINELLDRTLIPCNPIPPIDTSSKPPYQTLFLVGNHRSGARALVAARHLRDRGISSVCCVLGLDRPGHTLDAEVKSQLSRIRTPDTAVVTTKNSLAASVVVASWREVVKFLAHDSSQAVWVDALLAPGHGYDTLVPEEQVAVKEMVAWTNREGAKVVVSVDVPCGINASTGEFLLVL